ncbi:hypothetical protein QFZ79_003105 [Arthrobacter sp. V4I6]|nr:hypothetical protein [Arthrobacter sp. V1I7]MDQ0854994.1 hypothetical protein [Arthrobacter sp. V4I6]
MIPPKNVNIAVAACEIRQTDKQRCSSDRKSHRPCPAA